MIGDAGRIDIENTKLNEMYQAEMEAQIKQLIQKYAQIESMMAEAQKIWLMKDIRPSP
jgi:hypothetical protein